ncbi:MAG: HPF/RaiA family ribosome-associated protein [Alphaproteobacteria bacterium]|nr:HPF/RaiA family ribosome-associated protein [Alphaproteobacteria bacterium]
MNFSFSGRHMEIGESLTQKAREVCEKLAKKYRVEFLDANIVMKKESYLFTTDMTIKTNTGNSYFVVNSAEDPIVSFEIAVQKLEQQFQKKKKPGKYNRKVEINTFDNPVSGSEENAPMIVAEILDDLPLMSVSEAAKRLNENQHVFIFENISNSAVNVVYWRNDGNIGWLDYKIKRQG